MKTDRYKKIGYNITDDPEFIIEPFNKGWRGNYPETEKADRAVSARSATEKLPVLSGRTAAW